MTNLTLVLGRRRQGKSTLALALALARHDTVVFWDPNDQMQGWPIETSSIDVVSAWLESEEKPLVIVFRPRRGQLSQDFAALVELLFDWHDVALVVDEASDLQTSHSLDEPLEHLVRRWHDDCTLIQATHRFSDTNPLARQNASDTYLFYNGYRPDLEVLKSYYGEEISGLVKSLPRFELVHIWLEAGGYTRYAVWDTPEAWYIPLAVSNNERQQASEYTTA